MAPYHHSHPCSRRACHSRLVTKPARCNRCCPIRSSDKWTSWNLPGLAFHEPAIFTVPERTRLGAMSPVLTLSVNTYSKEVRHWGRRITRVNWVKHQLTTASRDSSSVPASQGAVRYAASLLSHGTSDLPARCDAAVCVHQQPRSAVFRFSGVAYARLRMDVLVVRGCLRLRQGAGGCRRGRHGYRQRFLADLGRLRSPVLAEGLGAYAGACWPGWRVADLRGWGLIWALSEPGTAR